MECTETPALLGERQLKHSRSQAPAWERHVVEALPPDALDPKNWVPMGNEDE